MTRIKLAHRSEHTVILFNDVACKRYGQMSIIVQRYAVIASIEKIHLKFGLQPLHRSGHCRLRHVQFPGRTGQCTLVRKSNQLAKMIDVGHYALLPGELPSMYDIRITIFGKCPRMGRPSCMARHG